MTTDNKPSRKKEDYDNLYDYKVQWLWAEVSSDDDLEGKYPNILHPFVKRTERENRAQTLYTNKVKQVPETAYDKSYQLSLVVRLMKERMFTKKLTRCSDGTKRRLTPRKEYLNMAPHEEILWISLQEEVRFASRNGEERILLSYQEERLIN